jgi:IS5 family transposase
VDLGYRGREVEETRILHRGKPKRMSKAEKRLLKRRQAVEPAIGHLKADHRTRRNFLKGALGDAMNSILAAAGFNIRWLMRWLVVFWRWILSGVLRLMRQSGSDARSDLVTAAA